MASCGELWKLAGLSCPCMTVSPFVTFVMCARLNRTRCGVIGSGYPSSATDAATGTYKAAASLGAMVEQIAGMPEGTLGFRLSGKLTRDEYFQILNPVRARLERGEKVSFLVETAPDFN